MRHQRLSMFLIRSSSSMHQEPGKTVSKREIPEHGRLNATDAGWIGLVQLQNRRDHIRTCDARK